MYLTSGYFTAFAEIFILLARHRGLAIEMARREILDRYSGQVFGPIWAIAHPIFMMGLYVFIFAFVFRTRVGGTVEMPLDYTAYLLSGLVAWIGCVEVMNKACTAITANANIVKQVVFPIEILPIKGVIAALFPQSVSLAILAIYVVVTHGVPSVTWLLLPVLMVMQLLLMIGISLLLASIGAFFRDIKDFILLFTLAGPYLVPVFYLPDWVPALFKPFLYLNPFSYLVWCYQDALYFGRFVHPWAWGITAVLSLLSFVLGYRVFRKLKPLLGSVL